jgi:hypothetical protein
LLSIDDEIKFLTIKVQTENHVANVQLLDQNRQLVTSRSILGGVVLYQLKKPTSGSWFLLLSSFAGSYRYIVSAAFTNPIAINAKYFIQNRGTSRPIAKPLKGNFKNHYICYYWLINCFTNIYNNFREDFLNIETLKYSLFIYVIKVFSSFVKLCNVYHFL